MTSSAESALAKMGLILPAVNKPGANYVAFQVSGNRVYIAGQICKWNGEMIYQGSVEKDVSIEDAKLAAQICALNILYQLKNACGGNLDRVSQCLKLTVYINSEPDFTKHAEVANGATEVLLTAFGIKGEHARVSVGCVSLPGNSTVEVCGEFEINGSDRP